MSDIRASLPVVVKSGTTHKPVWVLNGPDGEQRVRFVQPLNKAGIAPNGKRPRLGKRVLGKYVAGKTVKNEDLLFVGVFAPVRQG